MIITTIMEPTELALEDLIERMSEKTFLASVNIYISIEECTPFFIGLPLHFAYVPVINVKTDHTYYLTRGKTSESPDEELLRLHIRIQAYEIASRIVDKLSGKPKGFFGKKPIDIKIDDLPVSEAQKLIELYKKELSRVEEAHKKWVWV